jgi:glycosyltransferase involved in cell wall biosynthesis
MMEWMKTEAKPDLVNLTNLLIGGLAPAIKRDLGIPVLVTLQGDDLFLNHLEEPYKSQVITEMKRLARQVDGFVVNSEYYAQEMAALLEEPREKFHLVPLGLKLSDFETVGPSHGGSEGGQTIGYLARICPEKGLHLLVDAFIRLRGWPDTMHCTLQVAGWLGADDREYFEEQVEKLRGAGLLEAFDYRGVLDREEKLAFYDGLDVFSVPAIYREPKGLYVLEALASGVPVVLPAHGIFPEMIEQTGGGELVDPGSAGALAEKIGLLLHDENRRRKLSVRGRERVFERFSADEMARATLDLYSLILERDRRYA